MAVQKCIVTSKIKQWRHLIWKDGSAFGFGPKMYDFSWWSYSKAPKFVSAFTSLYRWIVLQSWRRWDRFHAIQVYSGTSVSTLNFYMWTSAGFRPLSQPRCSRQSEYIIYTVLCVLLFLHVFVVQITDWTPASARERGPVCKIQPNIIYYVFTVCGTCFGKYRYSYVRGAFLCFLQVLMRTRITSAAAKAWRTGVNHGELPIWMLIFNMLNWVMIMWVSSVSFCVQIIVLPIGRKNMKKPNCIESSNIMQHFLCSHNFCGSKGTGCWGHLKFLHD